MARSSCCSILTCTDTERCSCANPKTPGDAYRLSWMGLFLILIAIMFLCIAIFVPPAVKRSFDRTLRHSQVLTTDSASFGIFEDNRESPMQLDVYLFDVTNTRDIVEKGAKPIINEVGPYRYKVYRTAVDIEWPGDGTQIEWKWYEHYEFDADGSVGDDTKDTITSSNMPFLGASNTLIALGMGDTLDRAVKALKVDDKSPYYDEVNMAYTTRTVHDYLFGYAGDPLLAKLSEYTGGIVSSVYDGIFTNYTSKEDAQKRALVQGMYTGTTSPNSARIMYKFKGSDRITIADNICPWGDINSQQCKVAGYDGGAFGTLDDDDKRMRPMWNGPFLRVAPFYVDKHVDIQGLPLWEYRNKDTLYQTPDKNPDNAPYNIIEDGILPMTATTKGVPLFFTRPRWAGISSESTYWTSTDIKWLADKHDVHDLDTFILVEPRTGATVRLASTSMIGIDQGTMTYSYDDWLWSKKNNQLSNSHDNSIQEEEEEKGDDHHHRRRPDPHPHRDTEQQQQQQDSTVLSSDTTIPQHPRPRRHHPHHHAKHSSSSSSSSALSSLIRDNNDSISSLLSSPISFSPFSSTSDKYDLSSRLDIVQEYISGRQKNRNLPQQVEDEVTVTYFANMAKQIHSPLLWVNQSASATDDQLHSLAITYKAVDSTVRALPILCGVISGILFLLGLFFFIKARLAACRLIKELQINGNNNGTEFDSLSTLDALSISALYHPSSIAAAASTVGRSRSVVGNRQQNELHTVASSDQLSTSKPYLGYQTYN